ncbi:MAG: GntR family transcriptional regulator [Lachnospiraceae bacterium]|nr:GntR family transcriptional regulator [Lachnospiraceae bacterium]
MEESRAELQDEVTDKYSLRGRVFNRLREDILSGKYGEGEELREIAIGTEMGVSRTPVREAIRQLELEGLVKIIPNKGAYVTGISEKDIHDIYHIRSYLEGLCARWACVHITQERLEQLEEIIYLSEFHTKKKHWEQVVELDNKFHEAIYEACESKMLEHILRDFHHYVERVRRISLAEGERAQHSNREHTAILEAIRARDGERAERLAHEHIMRTIDNLSRCGQIDENE